MKTVLKPKISAVLAVPLFALTLLAAFVVDARADTDVLVGEVGQFTSPDDLHLDPALVVVAVAVFGDADRDVNGVTFQTDGQGAGSGVVTNGDVTVTTRAANQINDWAGAPSFTGGTPNSAANLAAIMQDIRWEAAPNPLTVDIEGLLQGAPYELQLLFNEGADRNRRWDIGIEGELVVDDITSEGLHTQVWAPNNSAYYKGEVTGPADGVLNIVLQQNIGGQPSPGGDNNPILQAVIVHLVDATDDDGDGILDVSEQRIIDFDPNDAVDGLEDVMGTGAAPAITDFDGDGISDGDEIDNGTDPTKQDTDDDGLPDNVETNTGTYVDATDTGTNPKLADTDKDGLLDGVETNTGIFVSASDTGTDPHNPNTDGDRRNDGDEVALGTDPNDQNDPGLPSPGDLAAELTAYYNFDNNLIDEAHNIAKSASTVADDLAFASGHSTNFGPGLFGDAGYLGGGPGTGHAEAPDSPDVDPPADQQFTVSWWGRHDVAFNAGWQCGVAKGEGNNWRFHRTGGDNSISWQGGGGDINNAAVNVNDQEWHHYVGTKEEDGSRILYVDGVQVATGAAGTAIADTATNFMVGENPEANNREWQGDIDDVAIWHRALTPEDVEVVYANGLAGKSLGDLIAPSGDPFGLAVRNVGGQLEISWNSIAGNLYDLVSDLGLDSEIASWAAFGANTAIPATPDRNTLTIPYPADATRYFAIKQYPVPPVKAFSDDFEGGQGSWVTADSGVPFPPNLNPSAPTATKWELGTPDAGVAGGPPAAHSGTNCFGTDLAAAYVEDTGISLTSPPIDLTNFVGGTLVYWQFLDIETTFDFGTVRLLDAADDSEIAVLEDTVDGTITDWEEVRIDLPAEAAGKSVKIQFTFACDNFNTNPQAGFYLDDFCVEAVPE